MTLNLAESGGHLEADIANVVLSDSAADRASELDTREIPVLKIRRQVRIVCTGLAQWIDALPGNGKGNGRGE